MNIIIRFDKLIHSTRILFHHQRCIRCHAIENIEESLLFFHPCRHKEGNRSRLKERIKVEVGEEG